jgi:hypothetical protein
MSVRSPQVFTELARKLTKPARGPDGTNVKRKADIHPGVPCRSYQYLEGFPRKCDWRGNRVMGSGDQP